MESESQAFRKKVSQAIRIQEFQQPFSLAEGSVPIFPRWKEIRRATSQRMPWSRGFLRLEQERQFRLGKSWPDRKFNLQGTRALLSEIALAEVCEDRANCSEQTAQALRKTFNLFQTRNQNNFEKPKSLGTNLTLPSSPEQDWNGLLKFQPKPSSPKAISKVRKFFLTFEIEIRRIFQSM